MRKFLSIITPTYNRETKIKSCYETLLKQSCHDFEWIIVDDGSTDNTPYLVEQFMKEGKINIIFHRKENGGKHTALNVAFNLINSEATLILDSDDLLVQDAVKIIKDEWNTIKSKKDICGIIFLRQYRNGKIIGDRFPKDEGFLNHIDFINQGIRGDKCEVIKTNILKGYQFPVYKNEKFIGESVLWLDLANKYNLLYKNQAIYITEYLINGLTKSGKKMRLANPRGGLEYAKKGINKNIILRKRIKFIVLYIIYSKILGKSYLNIILQSQVPLLCLFLLPIANIIFYFWRYRYM